MKTFISIQYLRAFAALGVVAFHTNLTGPVGQAGVDVFFVISGFIMSLVTQRETKPGDFMLHRLVRIWPLYAIATLVMAIHNHADIGSILLSLGFIPHRDEAGNIWPILVQGWTLNYEMFFYLLMAACLFLPARRQAMALTVVIVALAALGAVLQPQNPILKTYTSPLLLEFAAGVWLGRLSAADRLPNALAGGLLVVAGLAGFALSYGFNGEEHLRALLWGVPSLLLVTGVLSLERAGRVADIKPLKILGDASYSIYLFHPFIVKTVEQRLHGLPAPLVVLGVVAAATVLGVAAYYLLERPMMKVMRGWTRKASPSKPR